MGDETRARTPHARARGGNSRSSSSPQCVLGALCDSVGARAAHARATVGPAQVGRHRRVRLGETGRTRPACLPHRTHHPAESTFEREREREACVSRFLPQKCITRRCFPRETLPTNARLRRSRTGTSCLCRIVRPSSSSSSRISSRTSDTRGRGGERHVQLDCFFIVFFEVCFQVIKI